jgi:purine-nucleoside phosphorylase
MDEDPSALAARAAEALAERTGADHHDLFVVLGSGWAAMADGLPIAAEVAMADLPGFLQPGVEGHGATLRSVALGDLRILIALGRVHLYEGHPPAAVVHGVRAAAAAGCRMAVFTNASGSLHPEWGVGAPVLISDQINFTGLSPLTGGPHFAPMVDAYSPRLRRLAREVEPALPEGVYMGFHGPEFETPAEVRAARAWGADVVGMSTVLEVIAARHLGMEVLGLSLATNLAAGLKPGAAVDIDEVFAVAREAAPKVSALLARIIRRIADAP